MGKRIGDYEVVTELARGGMGVVYRARELSTGREVALKEVFHPDERFAQEAEAIARLDHPGIVRVHRFDPTAQPPYLVMELVEGTSLEARAREGLALEEVLHIAPQLCEALAHAHERGVLHRDLKPANVLLTAAGEPKLTDFGLGKVVDQSQHLTQTGEILGTPAFMAPEQAAGLVEAVGRPADVYGLGATLYAALTGQAPFHSRSMVEVLYAVLHKTPPPPSSLRPDVPRWLDAVILRCLEKAPAARYPDPLALRDALAAGPAGGPSSRSRGPIVAAALLVCALALGLAWLRRPTPPPPAGSPLAATPAPEASPETTPERSVQPRAWSLASRGAVGVAFDGNDQLWTLGAGRLSRWDLTRDDRVESVSLSASGHVLAAPERGVLLIPRGSQPGVLRLAGEARELLFEELGRTYRIHCGPGDRLALINADDELFLTRPGDSPYRVVRGAYSWSSASYHPSGDRVALILEHADRERKDLLVWDLELREEIRRYPAPMAQDRRLRVVIYTAAGELIQGTSDGQLEFLDRHGLVQRLQSRQGWGSATVARATPGSPRGVVTQGDLLVTVARHSSITFGQLRVPASLTAWDLQLRRQVGDGVALEVLDPQTLAISPDGRWAAVGGEHGQVEVVAIPQPRSPPEPWRLSLGPGGSTGVAFNGIGELVVSCGDRAQVWNPVTHLEVRSFELPEGRGASLAWGASGGLVARGKNPLVWLREDGELRELSGVHARHVVSSRLGVHSACEEATRVTLFGVNEGLHELDLGGPLSQRGGMGFSPQGERLALTAGVERGGREEKRLFVFDTEGQVLVDQPVLHRGRCLAFDGERVFVGMGDTGQIHVYDLRDHDRDPDRPVWLDHTRLGSWFDADAQGGIEGVMPAAHPDQEVLSLAWFGRRLYSVGCAEGGDAGELKAWSRDGRLLWTEPLPFVPEDRALAVSADGQWIAVGGLEGQAWLSPTWGSVISPARPGRRAGGAVAPGRPRRRGRG